MLYLSALVVRSRRGAIQIHIYLYLTVTPQIFVFCELSIYVEVAAVAVAVQGGAELTGLFNLSTEFTKICTKIMPLHSLVVHRQIK